MICHPYMKQGPIESFQILSLCCRVAKRPRRHAAATFRHLKELNACAVRPFGKPSSILIYKDIILK